MKPSEMPLSRALTIACAALLALLVLPAGATAKKTPKGFFGVVPQEPLSNQDYKHLQEGRVRTIRLSFNWAFFQQVDGQCKPQPQVGVCSWTVMDGIVGTLAQSGVRVIPTLASPPPFVNKNPTRPPLDGRDLKRWKAFLASVAGRYGRKGVFWQSYDDYGAKPLPFHDYQVWNEQNSKQFWSPAPNAKKYAKLVKASAKALRKGDRKAKVILGGMFPDAKVPIGPYMRDFYRTKKIGKFFDQVGVHPYARSTSELKRQLADANRAARGNTRMFISEMGWSSSRGGHPLNKGPSGQAKMLKKGFRLVTKKRRSWNISGVIWFALRDTNNQSTCSFCLRSGLLEVNGNPKPAWRAFKKFSK
jgi:hypothetical protein